MPTWTCNGKFPGEPLSDDEKRSHLYHFTSFETFVKIWLSKELLFSDVRRVNDILESRISWSLSQNQQLVPLIYALEDARYAYKQISLTMDYDSYMKGCMSSIMWGYYGDKTNGVCIELDFSKLDLSSCLYSPIKYKEDIQTTIDIPNFLRTRNDVEKWIVENQERLFFIKQSTWSGENEFRIVSNRLKSLDISNAIVAIYITDYASDICLFVSKLVQDKVPVQCVSYQDTGAGINIPRCTDAMAKRVMMENAQNNPSNFLNSIRNQSLAFYDLHKDDWDFPLVLDRYIIEEK